MTNQIANDTITLPRVLLQCVLDVAVNSMSFTSGFLDNEEVEALRSIAAILSIDPMVVTPDNREVPLWTTARVHLLRRCPTSDVLDV
jgi:hypothetical protein